MALKPIQFRVSDDVHAALQAQATRENRAMGRVLGDDILNVTVDDILKAIRARAESTSPPKELTKKTQLLIPPEAIAKLKALATLTGINSEFLIRLTMEAKRL